MEYLVGQMYCCFGFILIKLTNAQFTPISKKIFHDLAFALALTYQISVLKFKTSLEADPSNFEYTNNHNPSRIGRIVFDVGYPYK